MEGHTVRDPQKLLRYAAVIFGATLLFHNGDHFRRGTDTITDQVMIAGTIVGIISLVAIAFVFVRHPRAPLIATGVGFAVAVGIFASHLLPHWSELSDSFPDGDPSALSWAAVLSELFGGLIFGAAGLYALRAHAPAVTPSGSAPGSR